MALFSAYPYDPSENPSVFHAVFSLKVNSVTKEGNRNVLEKCYGKRPIFYTKECWTYSPTLSSSNRSFKNPNHPMHSYEQTDGAVDLRSVGTWLNTWLRYRLSCLRFDMVFLSFARRYPPSKYEYLPTRHSSSRTSHLFWH